MVEVKDMYFTVSFFWNNWENTHSFHLSFLFNHKKVSSRNSSAKILRVVDFELWAYNRPGSHYVTLLLLPGVNDLKLSDGEIRLCRTLFTLSVVAMQQDLLRYGSNSSEVIYNSDVLIPVLLLSDIYIKMDMQNFFVVQPQHQIYCKNMDYT